MKYQEYIQRLEQEHGLSEAEWCALISHATEDDRRFAAARARERAAVVFGKSIYFRGIIEFTNYCKNDCLYCGIRRSNRAVSRYRLSLEDILQCCEEGYSCGFRTFVLQGGEDSYFTDSRMCNIITAIKARYPDCALTLSIGERSRASYQAMYNAGADRYLLRHESADPAHYASLHPAELSLENRMRCLQDLQEIGYQTGCGFMVGTPGQRPEHLAKDMLFLQEFRPAMVGIGPFIPHGETPFGDHPAGSTKTTLFLLSLCRIMMPHVLLPATTALGTLDQDGKKAGVLAGCNVIMPNLSPLAVRKKYMLYNNKVDTELTAAQSISRLRQQMEEIGYTVVVGRGDSPEVAGRGNI